MNIQDIKIAYFLGIGGIGMSAIARYFMEIGIEVHGYDKTRNDFTIELENEGFIIHYEEDIDAIPAQVTGKRGLVVYTPAIPVDNREYQYLLANKVKLYKRAEVLGMISRQAYTIAVAGTHGKTTTTSLIAHILNSCRVNFTAFLGGVSSNFNSNYFHRINGAQLMNKPIMVVEADEFDRSFLQLSPDIAIVTSTDADHLDIYGNASAVKKSFQDFLYCLKENGIAIINEKLDLQSKSETLFYGKGEDSDALYLDVKISNGRFSFFYQFGNFTAQVINGLPGFHNVENATAAITAALSLNLPLEDIVAACESFRGVRRRFEYIVKDDQHIVIDDYAHHPAELRACINSVKKLYPDKKLTGVFQPHLYSRTRDFAEEFAEVLDTLDECWLLDIYPARELPIEGINSEFLALKMQKTPLLIDKRNVLKRLEIEKPELLLLLGAGDIDQLVKPIKILYEKDR